MNQLHLINEYKKLSYKEYQQNKTVFIENENTPHEILKDIIENSREEIASFRKEQSKISESDIDGISYYEEVIEELQEEIHKIRNHKNYSPLNKATLNDSLY